MLYFSVIKYNITNMKITPKEIDTSLKDILHKFIPPLKIRINKEGSFEVAGTKETIQGKQKVDGFFFANIVPKEKDVRFYFFPIYTHAAEFSITNDLKKCLKGKSCFHFKGLDPILEKEISDMVKKGVGIYKQEGLI